MNFRDPVTVYNAESNIEAHLICNVLESSGISAYVSEDVSVVGLWAMGTLPEIHKPQIWIERADIERARPILDDYEQQAALRRQTNEATINGTDGVIIEVICEECGKKSDFPASQDGTIQECPACRAYVDVGDNEFTDEWRISEDEDESEVDCDQG